MKSIRKKAAGAAVAAAAAVGVAVSGPVLAGVNDSPATATQQGSGSTVKPMAEGAERNPYGPAEVCGSGYRIVDDPGGVRNKAKRPVVDRLSPGDPVLGYVYLLYNSSNGKNCVVVIKTTDVGDRSSAIAELEVQGRDWKMDNGYYKYYAGPVRMEGAGRCAKYRGTIISNNGYVGEGGRWRWGNCG